MDLRRPDSFATPEGMAWIASRGLTLVIALILVIGVGSSFVIIQPGFTGVIFNIWTGSLK
jgi:hypothetical protein